MKKSTGYFAAKDEVNHPSHYNVGKIEVIDAIDEWGLGFCLGNAVKYIARAGHKGDVGRGSPEGGLVHQSRNRAEAGRMKIVRPYMRLLSNGGVVRVSRATPTPWWDKPLQFVNWCARVSHRAEDAEKQDVERFLRSVVIDHGDWSVTEHVSVSVDAVVDRGITHEIVRHRLAAYTQESTRFVNYAKKMPPSFIYPIVGVECERCLGGDQPEFTGSYGWSHCNGAAVQERCKYDERWLIAISTAENEYKRLLENEPKWRPQEARSVFPNALASRIVITMNLRMWRHFFLMRTSAEAHPQMRQVTIPLLEEFKQTIPVLYEDIEPNGKQSENLKKGR